MLTCTQWRTNTLWITECDLFYQWYSYTTGSWTDGGPWIDIRVTLDYPRTLPLLGLVLDCHWTIIGLD